MPIRYVLFDLDNTLYTDASGLFAEVGRRIEAWVSRALAISRLEARELRRAYYAAHGTTMRGLLRHHPDVDVDDYLDYVHDIDVATYLQPNPALAAMLERLTHPKVIFTNGIRDWAERVTARLGVRPHFEDIIDVRAVDYQSKPAPHAYARALELLGVPGMACVLLDDQPSYLHGAAQAGMRTILVRPGGQASDGVDYAVDSVLDAEPVLRELLDQKG